MTDYERIARVIVYINEHFKEQPDLKRVAGAVHPSEFFRNIQRRARSRCLFVSD